MPVYYKITNKLSKQWINPIDKFMEKDFFFQVNTFSGIFVTYTGLGK